MSHVKLWLWSTLLKSHLAKIGGNCPNEGGDKAFFLISRDHTISESCDLVRGIPSLWITINKFIKKAAVLNNKNKNICMYYKFGASLCYKLGLSSLLKIGATAVTN